MEWLVENWFLVLVFCSLGAIQLFGHARGRMHMIRLKPVAIARVRPRAHPLEQAWPRESSDETQLRTAVQNSATVAAG